MNESGAEQGPELLSLESLPRLTLGYVPGRPETVRVFPNLPLSRKGKSESPPETIGIGDRHPTARGLYHRPDCFLVHAPTYSTGRAGGTANSLPGFLGWGLVYP